MRRWSYALGGLIAWAVHFAGVYGFVSLEAQTPAADRHVWQAAAVALSLACAAACAVLIAIASRGLRGPERSGPVTTLMDQLAALGGAVGLVAIAWQTLSATIS